jgi:hypothetical protein
VCATDCEGGVKKTPNIFVRGEDKVLRIGEWNPECYWVRDGEGVATRKWDGTACLVRDGKLFKRYDAKHGKTPPPAFEPAQPAPDPKSGHWPGWLPVIEGDPSSKWHLETWLSLSAPLPDGTYELCGPKVGGNPEGFDTHRFIRHGEDVLHRIPPAAEAIRQRLARLALHEMEGIVFHHPDGRMAKIRRGDFGLPWPVNARAHERDGA